MLRWRWGIRQTKDAFNNGRSSKAARRRTAHSHRNKRSHSIRPSRQWTWPCRCKTRGNSAFGTSKISSRISSRWGRLMGRITATWADIIDNSKRDSWRTISLHSIILIFLSLAIQAITRQGHISQKDFRKDRVSSTSMILSDQRRVTNTPSPSHLQTLCHRRQWRSLRAELGKIGGGMMILRVRTGQITTISPVKSLVQKRTQIKKRTKKSKNMKKKESNLWRRTN